MKKNREFNNILDECLERLLAKGETIEQCLQSYSEQAAELEPLLQTALATKKASVIQPRPEFRAKARYQFRSALQEIGQKRRFSLFGWQSQWATVVAVALVLMLVGGGTSVAASNSMPDGLLYPVKLATEEVRLTLTPSALGKAELYARLADKRVTEIVYMATKNKPKQIEQTARRLDACLMNIAVLSSTQEVTADVTTAPAPRPAPAVEEAPTAEKALTVEEAPAVREPLTVEEAPAVEKAPAVKKVPAKPERVKGDKEARIKADRRASLRATVVRHATNHSARLRAILETAPQSARPALLQTIAISETGYKKALEALD